MTTQLADPFGDWSPPSGMPASSRQDFERLAAECADVLFVQLLPRYIDQSFRGRGYELIWCLMDAHDGRTVEAVGALPAPSHRAVRMAAELRRACPFEVVDGPVAPQPGGLLLGLFVWETLTNARFLTDYHEVASDRVVYLFADSFHRLGLTGDALRSEVLHTLLHEYIHCLESFLPRRDRPLQGREHGLLVRSLTRPQARRRDSRYLLRRWLFWGMVTLVTVLAVVIAIVQGLQASDAAGT